MTVTAIDHDGCVVTVTSQQVETATANNTSQSMAFRDEYLRRSFGSLVVADYSLAPPYETTSSQ
jgi:hypothetical protein